MKKIELEIVALSHSITQTHSYAVVLGEISGLRRLPIVIGGFEAQAIAVALERMEPSRPLTHDLFANFMATFNIELQEVLIYKLEEGIFFAQLVCQGPDNEVVVIDARTRFNARLADTWEAVTPMNTPRENPGVVSAGGRIFVVGGASDVGPLQSSEVFNPNTNTWQPIDALLPVGRGSLSAERGPGNVILAFGGFEPGITASARVEALPISQL